MENFKVAGIASGFDWASMVDQLMEIERAPQQRLRAEQTSNTTKRDALSTLGTKLSTLNSRVASLNTGSLFNAKSVTLGDSTIGIKATASESASQGSYSISVQKLATTSKRMGSADVGGSMGDENTVLTNLRLAQDITEGTFQVNGQNVTVAATDTLQDVFDAISAATSGVVTASYDDLTDTVMLSSATGELELGSTNDSSNFLKAMKLDQLEVVAGGGGSSQVTSSKALGVVDTSSSIATSGLGITGTDTFHINGVAISFDADTESMQTLLARVNSSAAGVTMTYDSSNDQFRMVNKETGALAMPVIDSGNGMLAAMGLTGAATVGEDLEYSIDGGATQTSRRNSITGAEHGIEGLTIDAKAVGVQTVTIAKDTTELRSKIDSFILAYNDVQDYIQEKSKITVDKGKVTAATLASNREVAALDSSLRSLAFRSIDGMSGTIFRLEHLGIDFQSGTSKLEVKDNDALTSALANNTEDLQQLFNGDATNSFSARMKTFIDNYSSSSGILETQKTNLATRNTKIDEQIAEMERRIVSKRAALEASFIAMEEAQSNINTQSQALLSLQQ